MRAILMSIRPEWCEKIFNGEKTIEVRKSRPSIPTPFKVYVYETKGKTKYWSQPMPIPYTEGRGKVIGSFVCDRVFELKINGDDYGNYWHEWDDEGDIQDMCLSYEELETYLGKSVGYGWHISDLKIYDKPKELEEFYTKCDKTGNDECGDCLYLRVTINSYPCDDSVDTWCGVDNKKPISRPPQSWCYVEDK